MNYYDILEVSQTASPEVIQNAYKTLAKKYHPDVYQGDKSLAEEQMKQINEAYEVLSDPQKRMEYDCKMKEKRHSSSAHDASEGTKEKNSSSVNSVKSESKQSAGRQKRKKPFWVLSWIFITFLMFLSIICEWKWLFWASLVLGCARFIANKQEPAYKTRGLVRVISIGIVGFMIFSCYSVLYKKESSSDYTVTEETPTEPEKIAIDIPQRSNQIFIKSPQKYNIVYGTSFSDGIAFIKYYEEDYITAHENHSFIYAAIDTYGNELFRLNDFQDTGAWPIVKGGIYVINNSVYNNKGQLIASPQMSGYDEIYEGKNHNGYVIVTKYTESYKGAYYSIGVINNKGDWEVQLCEEGQWKSEDYSFTWANTSTYYGVDYCILEEELATIIGNNGQDIVSVNANGDMRVILKNHEVLLSISSSTVGNEAKVFGDDFLIAAEYIFDYDISGWVTGPYNVMDFNGNILLDLSEYNIVSKYGCDYFNGYFLFTVENNNGSEYLCLVDKTGELVIEPIKVHYPKIYKTYYPLNETGFVYYDAANDAYSHIGYDGKIIKYQNIDDFHGFFDGLALVEDEHQTYRDYYINYQGEIIVSKEALPSSICLNCSRCGKFFLIISGSLDLLIDCL